MRFNSVTLSVYMIRANIDVKELAKAIEISETTIYKILADRCKPSKLTCEKLANFFYTRIIMLRKQKEVNNGQRI